jgi:preprotein translocase subunit SecG
VSNTAPADYPGKTLGIVALILTFFFTLLGLILGLVAQSQSKAAGVKNTPAKVAVVLTAALTEVAIDDG